jgi:hypothetical protein
LKLEKRETHGGLPKLLALPGVQTFTKDPQGKTMRRDQLFWLVLIYLLLFIVGYWPELAKNRWTLSGHSQGFKPHAYSIPVTIQMDTRRDS